MISNFDSGASKYVGQKLEEKPHGKGKLLLKDSNAAGCPLYKLVYDGEWREGKPHGQGKAFHKSDKCAYEGEWSEGKPHGRGKQYYIYGYVMHDGWFFKGQHYQGDWKDGTGPHGEGKLFWEGEKKLKYEGGFVDGAFCGQGRSYSKFNKLEYDGGWENGRY